MLWIPGDRNSGYRAKQLLPERGHVAGDISENGRRVVVTLPCHFLAAQYQTCTFTQRRFYLSIQFVTQIGACHRAKEGIFIQRIAHGECLNRGSEAFFKFFSDRSFHNKAFGSHTHLPGILETSNNG